MSEKPKDFILSDDDDETLDGHGVPDDDGWIHLKKEQPDGLGGGDNRGKQEKHSAAKRRVARKGSKRAPRGNL